MSLDKLLQSEIAGNAASIVLLLSGLPLLLAIMAGWRRKGLGLPYDGAWPAVTWGRLHWGLPFVLAVFVCQSLLHQAAGTAANSLAGPGGLAALPRPTQAVAGSLATVAHWAIVCGAVLTWLALARKATAAALGLSTRRLAKSVGYGLVLLLAAEPLIVATLAIGNGVHAWLRGPAPGHPVLQSLGQGPQPVQMIVLFVTAGLVIPFFEELFFRGILQTTLMRSGSAVAAITVSSLLFGLVHLPVPTSVVPLTILGWAMGYAFYRTRSLASCVAMHSAFNLLSLSLTVLPQMIRAAH
ncbi:MAG: CPBP family intramembrane metalloprotease [Planctomycetes bacterium]|nr:CPBP family intramembrane metalloprotease [Planctomycetota bacterium]